MKTDPINIKASSQNVKNHIVDIKIFSDLLHNNQKTTKDLEAYLSQLSSDQLFRLLTLQENLGYLSGIPKANIKIEGTDSGNIAFPGAFFVGPVINVWTEHLIGALSGGQDVILRNLTIKKELIQKVKSDHNALVSIDENTFLKKSEKSDAMFLIQNSGTNPHHIPITKLNKFFEILLSNDIKTIPINIGDAMYIKKFFPLALKVINEFYPENFVNKLKGCHSQISSNVQDIQDISSLNNLNKTIVDIGVLKNSIELEAKFIELYLYGSKQEFKKFCYFNKDRLPELIQTKSTAYLEGIKEIYSNNLTPVSWLMHLGVKYQVHGEGVKQPYFENGGSFNNNFALDQISKNEHILKSLRGYQVIIRDDQKDFFAKWSDPIYTKAFMDPKNKFPETLKIFNDSKFSALKPLATEGVNSKKEKVLQELKQKISDVEKSLSFQRPTDEEIDKSLKDFDGGKNSSQLSPKFTKFLEIIGYGKLDENSNKNIDIVQAKEVICTLYNDNILSKVKLLGSNFKALAFYGIDQIFKHNTLVFSDGTHPDNLITYFKNNMHVFDALKQHLKVCETMNQDFKNLLSDYGLSSEQYNQVDVEFTGDNILQF